MWRPSSGRRPTSTTRSQTSPRAARWVQRLRLLAPPRQGCACARRRRDASQPARGMHAGRRPALCAPASLMPPAPAPGLASLPPPLVAAAGPLPQRVPAGHARHQGAGRQDRAAERPAPGARVLPPPLLLGVPADRAMPCPLPPRSIRPAAAAPDGPAALLALPPWPAQLPNAFLSTIDRGSHTIHAVSPQEVLEAGDVLWFAGEGTALHSAAQNRAAQRTAHSTLAPCHGMLPHGHHAPGRKPDRPAVLPTASHTGNAASVRFIRNTPGLVPLAERQASRLRNTATIERRLVQAIIASDSPLAGAWPAAPGRLASLMGYARARRPALPCP